jgi:hypothetical protein
MTRLRLLELTLAENGNQAAGGRQHECVFELRSRDAALAQLGGQHSVRTADLRNGGEPPGR